MGRVWKCESVCVCVFEIVGRVFQVKSNVIFPASTVICTAILNLNLHPHQPAGNIADPVTISKLAAVENWHNWLELRNDRISHQLKSPGLANPELNHSHWGQGGVVRSITVRCGPRKVRPAQRETGDR